MRLATAALAVAAALLVLPPRPSPAQPAAPQQPPAVEKRDGAPKASVKAKKKAKPKPKPKAKAKAKPRSKTAPRAKPKAKPTPAQKPAPRATPQEEVPAPTQTGPRLSMQEAAVRYEDAVTLEARGDEPAAFQAFLEAAEGGHGLAQRKLGEIYDKGNSAVSRDYETSLRWYQKAREQGVPIAKPPSFPKGH